MWSPKPRQPSSRRRLFGALWIALSFAACEADTPSESDPIPDELPSCAPREAPPFCAVDEDQIELTLAAMSLRERLAQMLFVGLDGSGAEPPERTVAAVRDIGVGGVFLQGPPARACTRGRSPGSC